MTPEQAKASLARQIAMHGETATLRRLNASPPHTEETGVAVFVRGYEPDELVGAIQQGDRKIIVPADNVGSFPVPFRERSTDRIEVRGQEMTIQAVDDSTRRIAGTLVAYEIRVRG